MTIGHTFLTQPAVPATQTPPLATVARGLAAAGVLMSADVHLMLYLDGGFSTISVVGPAFLLNAIGGIMIALLVLLWRHPLSALLAVAFGVATLNGIYLSAMVGLFGVHEAWGGTQVITAEVAEWVAIAGGATALILERRSARR